MKVSRAVYLVSFVLIVAVVSLAYSWQTRTRLGKLERRLLDAEGALQSQRKPAIDTDTAAHIRNLEKRVRRAELAPMQAQLVGGNGSADVFRLEHRVQKIEQQINPHLEVLPPYVPNN